MNATLITNSHGASLHDSACPALRVKLQSKDVVEHTEYSKRHEIIWAISGKNVAIHSCLKDHAQLRRSA